MDGYKTSKKYESIKIPGRKQAQEHGDSASSISAPVTSASSSDDMYYEIDYDSCPIPGVGKFVLKPKGTQSPDKIHNSERIQKPERDEIRELFGQMREIAREHYYSYDFSRFFDRLNHHEKGIVFYKQGMFMKDFTDDFSGNAPFSRYFPEYQMMGYEQLRTYFTWRTQVREGNVTETALSYAFLYIYELLSNIGVGSSQEGLDKLMFFWKEFRVHCQAIDQYVLRWLKDYHIYYDPPQPFKEFIKANNLTEHYPDVAAIGERFDLFCAISKYDIRKSAFFTEDKAKLITDCFYFVMDKLNQTFFKDGTDFERAIFRHTKKMQPWVPFKDALFCQWKKQPDRGVVLSEKDVYRCIQNKWFFTTTITAESGRQVIGYVMKQMEAVLRKVTGYKFKLTANLDAAAHEGARQLVQEGFPLEKTVTDATLEYYREATRTVVQVDLNALETIRRDALIIQEKLIVPEQELPPEPEQELPPEPAAGSETKLAVNEQELGETGQSLIDDPWQDLKGLLTEMEKKALWLMLRMEDGDGMESKDGSAGELKKFADSQGIMLEVLMDGINEKAMDIMGDNLMDEDMVLYEEYKEQVKELIE